MKSILLMICFFLFSALGGKEGGCMEKFQEEGQKFVEENPIKIPNSAENVPGYEGENVPEANLTDSHLKEATKERLSKEPVADFLQETIKNTPPFEMDPEKDPLITGGDKILSHSEKEWGLTLSVSEENPKKTIKKCRRGARSHEKKCTWTVAPKQIGTKTIRETHILTVSGQYLFDNSFRFLPHVGYKGFRTIAPITETSPNVLEEARRLFPIRDVLTGKEFNLKKETIVSANVTQKLGGDIIYQKDKGWDSIKGPKYYELEIKTEEIVPEFDFEASHDCSELEDLIDSGNCEYVSTNCLDNKPRIKEGVTLSPPCWAEERVYSCSSPLENTCQSLLKEGCSQISSECLAKEGLDCVEWENTFECYEGNRSLATSSLSGEKPYCLDGDCIKQSWAPNKDMADSLSKLMIFNEMQKDIHDGALSVFKGKPQMCSRNPINFKDCCVQKGWGVKVGLVGCSEDEKALSEERQKGKCLLVGTFCAKKEFGICLSKKTTFCCFANKLSRIIHEQGRKQLGMSFGSPENPNCDGLTVEQFTQLDFSKIDLSELLEEFLSKLKTPDIQKIGDQTQKSLEDRKGTSQTAVQGRGRDAF